MMRSVIAVALAGAGLAALGCTEPNPRFWPHTVPARADAAVDTTADAAFAVDRPAPRDAEVAHPDGDGDGSGPGTDTRPPAPADAPAPSPDAAATSADRPPDLTAPSPDATGGVPAGATTAFTFETSAEGWTDLRYRYFGVAQTPVVRSMVRAWEGSYGLEISLRTTASYTNPTIGVAQPFRDRLRPGTVVTYHVWFPAGGAIARVQPFAMYYRPGDPDNNPVWSGSDVYPASRLRPGEWNVVTHRVPTDADARGVVELGVEWVASGAQTVKVFIDAVYW